MVTFFEVLMWDLEMMDIQPQIFPHQIELWDSNDICVVGTQHPDSGQKKSVFQAKQINNAHIIVFLVTEDQNQRL